MPTATQQGGNGFVYLWFRPLQKRLAEGNARLVTIGKSLIYDQADHPHNIQTSRLLVLRDEYKHISSCRNKCQATTRRDKDSGAGIRRRRPRHVVTLALARQSVGRETLSQQKGT